MNRMENPLASARPRIAALAVAALLAAAAPAASASTPEEGAASAHPTRMKIAFSGRTARVAGPGAIVQVRCTGTVAASCDGTLTLAVGAESQEIPYTLAGGERRILVVPLGASDGLLERAGSVTALAVAETVQPTGGVVSSKHRLRLS
jgi:hypothetical protein